MSAADAALTSPEHPLLLFFDGECAFCDRWVMRLKQADRAHRIRFATKQGATFQRVIQARPEFARVASVVVVARRADGSEEFLIRSPAVRELIRGLPGFGFFSALLAVTPTPLANIGYGIFSRLRTRLFGRLDQCRVPTPEERALYLD